MKIFITGIGTGVGKTIVSAILTEALQADYWKPIQSGNLENSDTVNIRRLLSNTKTKFHEETYKFKTPESPHLAAEAENKIISLTEIKCPKTSNHLIIEGAGGLMVPLNNHNEFIIDLIKQLQTPVILVTQNYLGSINHTLLSIEILKKYSIPVKAIVFNGENKPSSEEAIVRYTSTKNIIHIPKISEINKENIALISQNFKKQFLSLTS